MLLHAIAPPLSFLALVAACLVVARRFAADGRRAAAFGTRIVAAACLLLAVPVGPGVSWRLFVGSRPRLRLDHRLCLLSDRQAGGLNAAGTRLRIGWGSPADRAVIG